MKVLSIALAVLFVTGCATVPDPDVVTLHNEGYKLKKIQPMASHKRHVRLKYCKYEKDGNERTLLVAQHVQC